VRVLDSLKANGMDKNTIIVFTADHGELGGNHQIGIRSAFDGRYRFSRYFSPLDFNTPTTYETLVAKNDLELYDIQEDAEEVHNLAADQKVNGELIMAMNAKLNGRIADEVGDDNGSFIPIRNGKWFFPPKSKR
jgi:arylsulfatase A-like enzyme